MAKKKFPNPISEASHFPDLGTKFNNLRAVIVANNIQRFAREDHGFKFKEESTNPNHTGQILPSDHEPPVTLEWMLANSKRGK